MVNTHDYSGKRRTFGHDYTFTPINGGLEGDMIGWGHGIKVNDYIILGNETITTRYQFTEIEYYGDPPDMWHGKVKFSPRPMAGIET